jgi:hypothetical protein
MTPQELAALKAYIALTAAYYGQDLADAVIAMYAEDLSDLPLADVKAAISLIRKDPKVTRFPLPAVIRARISPQETPEDAARLAESEIWKAVGTYGYPNAKEAQMALGALAWEGVQRSGGWARVCASANEGGPSFRAQMRGTLEAVYRRAQAGRLEERVALPEPEHTASISRIAFKPMPGDES